MHLLILYRIRKHLHVWGVCREGMEMETQMELRVKLRIPKLGRLSNGCSCWKAPGMFLPTLSISQLCNPQQPASGELPKATQPLADTIPPLT